MCSLSACMFISFLKNQVGFFLLILLQSERIFPDVFFKKKNQSTLSGLQNNPKKSYSILNPQKLMGFTSL